MALVELVEKENAPPEVLEIYEMGESVYGQVLQTWKALANNPSVFQAYLPYVRAVFGPGPLDQRTKDLIAVRVCYLNECLYSMSHRVFSARNQGISEADLAGLADPSAHDFTEREQVALAFAEELTVNVGRVSYAENASGVSPETLVAVKEQFNNAEINDLAIAAGIWNFLTRYHRVMDLDLDMPAPPSALDFSAGGPDHVEQ